MSRGGRCGGAAPFLTELGAAFTAFRAAPGPYLCASYVCPHSTPILGLPHHPNPHPNSRLSLQKAAPDGSPTKSAHPGELLEWATLGEEGEGGGGGKEGRGGEDVSSPLFSSTVSPLPW